MVVRYTSQPSRVMKYQCITNRFNMFTYYPYFNPEITHLTILMYAKNASKTPTIKHLTYECPLLSLTLFVPITRLKGDHGVFLTSRRPSNTFFLDKPEQSSSVDCRCYHFYLLFSSPATAHNDWVNFPVYLQVVSAPRVQSMTRWVSKHLSVE